MPNVVVVVCEVSNVVMVDLLVLYVVIVVRVYAVQDPASYRED